MNVHNSLYYPALFVHYYPAIWSPRITHQQYSLSTPTYHIRHSFIQTQPIHFAAPHRQLISCSRKQLCSIDKNDLFLLLACSASLSPPTLYCVFFYTLEFHDFVSRFFLLNSVLDIIFISSDLRSGDGRRLSPRGTSRLTLTGCKGNGTE